MVLKIQKNVIIVIDHIQDLKQKFHLIKTLNVKIHLTNKKKNLIKKIILNQYFAMNLKP